MGSRGAQRRLVAVLAADVAGYTRLVEQDTDATVAAWKAARDDVIKPLIDNSAGRIIKFTGDGFLAEFPSVQDAVGCAIAMQEGLYSSPLGFRMGVSVGDVTDDGEDIHGEGVNIAARLEALAEAGGIIISGDVYNQVRNRIAVNYKDIGLQTVKHVSAPVQAYVINPSAQTGGSAGSVSVATHGNAEARKPSIAVLAFSNLSGDPEQEYFADGMVEEIITGLARIRWLTVIARNSTFAYKGTSPDVRKVGRELAVRYVVEGSVRKAGNSVRITAQLIEADTGGHLWAEKFTGTLDHVFELQDQITAGVVAAIEPTVRKAEIERSKRKRPDNLDAYDLYLRALEHSYTYTPEGRAAGLALLEAAIALDPDYAEAHGIAAFCRQQRYLWGGRSPADREAALHHAEAVAAARTEDAAALAFAAMALAALDGREDEGLVMVERALEWNPNSAIAHSVSAILFMMHARLEESVAHAELSLRLSPFDPMRHLPEFVLAIANLAAGKHAAALACARRGLEANPAFTPGLTTVALCLVGAGRVEEAQATVQRVLDLAPDTRIATLKERYLLTNGIGIEKVIAYMRRAGLPE